MNKSFFSLYNSNARPAREQNLFVGLSKHLYCLADGTLKHQKKPIDPRIPGSKRLITRFVLLDTDTGTVYGEVHAPETSKDLAGFLARAWSKKAAHPMKGIPSILNIPQSVHKDSDYAEDMRKIQSWAGISVGELPSGFAAGVHAVKQFERSVGSLLWRASDMEPADIFIAKACSAVLSVEASGTSAFLWKERWDQVAEPDDAFFAAIDKLYTSEGAWRLAPFDFVLNGLPR